MLQGTEPKTRQLGQCLFKRHSLSSELGDLEASFQREFRNLWASDGQVPPVLPLWNGRIIVKYSDCVSLLSVGSVGTDNLSFYFKFKRL